MKESMDAPIYLPAVEFVPPTETPYQLRLDNVSLAELLAVPAARDIVFKYLPFLKFAVGSPGLKPQMGNMTVRSLDTFIKPPSPDVYAIIDEELSHLPLVIETVP
jgi:hypothetical protein